MCEWFDESCGDLLKIIDENGDHKNTLVIYVTDNGWIQNPNRGGYDARSKQTPYEGGIRTPIMFRWPSKMKPEERNELVSSIDIVPTILAASGARTPESLPGINLLPNLENRNTIKRDTIFGESFAHDIADLNKPEASLLFRWAIKDKWKLLLTYDGEVNRYKSTHPRNEKRPQLFDLNLDPHEKINLAKDNPKKVQELANAIQSWYPLKERKTITVFE